MNRKEIPMKEIVKAGERTSGSKMEKDREGIRSFAAVIIWHNYWLSLDDSTDKGARSRETSPSNRSIHVLKLYTYLRGKCFVTRFRMQSGFRSIEF